MSLLYIASRTPNGGIYKYTFNGKGYEQVSFSKMDSPMYMITHKNKMHVLLRSPFNNKESGYIRYDINESGDLYAHSEIISTKGEIACHLNTDGNHIYCVNYTSGSVIRLPDTLVVHSGDKMSHTHYVGFTPDRKYICVTDLGLDQIFLYDKALNLVDKINMPTGCGVRHLAFAKNDYIFTANELDATVSVLQYTNGTMHLIDTVSCVRNPHEPHPAPSAIKIYQGKIYVAIRGENVISQLSFEDGRLKLQNSFDCLGKTPRDFCFDENRLICCNQESDTVTVFEETNGSFNFTESIDIKEPICTLTYDLSN